jgi:acetylornithine deacetylase/succinyl-diaminopimelate desuccinylase-like protein
LPRWYPIRAQSPIDPVPILRQLIGFDTSNPPGDEGPCIAYVDELLRAAGIQTRLLACQPGRPNLIARVTGRGLAPPLLLHAHADVVPAAGQVWSHPPFQGLIVDEQVFGRGAIDMKGELAMMLAAILRLRAEGTAPAGDVVLAVVADEESGSSAGAEFLAKSHSGLFADVAYAVGEDGGAALSLGDQRRFYPVVVGEKRPCWLRATLRGPGGHASRAADPEAATAKLGRLLCSLDGGLLGPHITPAVDHMLAELSQAAPEPFAACLEKLRDNPGDEAQLAGLPPSDSRYLRSVVHHTVNPTVIRAGSTTNVIPTVITVDLDGRLLPGSFLTSDFLAELCSLIGADVELEILSEAEPIPSPPLGPFYEILCDVIRRRDPGGLPVPMVTTASTDAQLFGHLGIRCYGWLPLMLPLGTRHRQLLHSADERVPVEAIMFGTQCFRDLLIRYR